MKITEQQRKDWFKSGKCHVCGKDVQHNHPRWMWWANPIPEFKEGELTKELVKEKEWRNEKSKSELKGVIGIK